MRPQEENDAAPEIDSLCSAQLRGPRIRAQPRFQASGESWVCWAECFASPEKTSGRSWQNLGGNWGLRQSACPSSTACMAAATSLFPSEVISTATALSAPRTFHPFRTPLLGISLRHKTFYFRCQQIIFQCLLQKFMKWFQEISQMFA